MYCCSSGHRRATIRRYVLEPTFNFMFILFVFPPMNQNSPGFDTFLFHCTGRVIICAYAPEEAMNEGSSQAENAANEGGEEAPTEGNQSTEAAATEQP